MAEWHGVGDRGVYRDEHQTERDGLADAAHRGDWARVLVAVEKSAGLVNTWRVAGRSGWAPLHQAAWHNAPTEVVERLLAAGAWRTLRSADGERPVDLATRLGREALVPILQPVPLHPVPEADLRAMEHFLHALIRVRTEYFNVTVTLVLPQVCVLTELPDPALWFTVPGMYGGFGVRLEEERGAARLAVGSHCRVVGHSGRTHHVTPDGCVPVESGW